MTNGSKSTIRRMRDAARIVVRATGYDVIPYYPGAPAAEHPRDFTRSHSEIIRATADYTLTSTERLYSLIEAVRYISESDIAGTIVECGVWKGAA
jgi:O-methyltransferase